MGAQIWTLGTERPLEHPGRSGVQRGMGHPAVALFLFPCRVWCLRQGHPPSWPQTSYFGSIPVPQWSGLLQGYNQAWNSG